MADQAAEMQEKLKSMSPEELKQFQIQNCIFCHIIKGKVASKKIYEDDKCLAILDINPANPGHILLLPKEHYAIMPLIPDDIIQHLFMIAKQLSSALLRALKADGTNIFVANGAAAGQKAQHFMAHIIPRIENDDVDLTFSAKKTSEKILLELQKTLAEKIAKDFGLKPLEISKKAEKPDEGNAAGTEFKENKEMGFLEPAEKPKEKKASKKKEDKKSKKQKEDVEVTLDDISSLITGKR
jgi:histidine triad (HIT) family protein